MYILVLRLGEKFRVSDEVLKIYVKIIYSLIGLAEEEQILNCCVFVRWCLAQCGLQ